MVYLTGTRRWNMQGELHHEDGPAVIDTDGNEYWYRNGELAPAVILSHDTVKVQTIDVSQFPSATILDDGLYRLDHVDMNLIRLMDGVMVVHNA